MSRSQITDENGDGHFGYGELLKPATVDALITQHNEHAEALDAIEAGASGSSNTWESTTLSWSEDFLWQGTLSVTGGWDQIPMFGIYGLKFAGTNTKIDTNNAATGRIGVVEMETGTDATGYCTLRANINSCDFGVGTWTYEAVVAVTDAADGTDDYSVIIGWADTPYQTDQTRGAYFLYDKRNVAVGGANPANANKWQAATCYGALAAQKTFTLINSPTVGSVTWPDTNVYRLKIVATSAQVLFYINGTLVATHTTNIPPTGTAGMTGACLGICKTAGTTARILNVDYARLAVTLNSARTP